MWRWLADALFPLECVGCGRERTIACADCVPSVRFFESQSELEGLDGLIAMYSYADPVVKGLLRNAKFHFVERTEEGIGQLTDRGLAKWGHLLPRGEDVIIVPIPTMGQRKRERGFDQIHWIAQRVVGYLDAPLIDALRAASHQRQSHLASDEERSKNIEHAFSLRISVQGKRVVLVDDVVTSGATIREAASVLRNGGAREIFGLALARGGMKKPPV